MHEVPKWWSCRTVLSVKAAEDLLLTILRHCIDRHPNARLKWLRSLQPYSGNLEVLVRGHEKATNSRKIQGAQGLSCSGSDSLQRCVNRDSSSQSGHESSSALTDHNRESY